MRIGLYLFTALGIIVLIGAFVHSVAPTHYALEVLGVNISLPVALWVTLPAVILFVYTLLHMMIYGLKGYLEMKRWRRDASTLDDAIYWSLLHEPKEQSFLVADMKDTASIFSKSHLSVTDHVEGLNPRLSKLVNILLKIKNGEYVDLKSHKLSKVFSAGNAYLIQNRLNRLDVDAKFVEEVIKSSTNYSDPVRLKALELFVQETNFQKARPFAKLFSKEHFFALLDRTTSEDPLGFRVDILDEFVEALSLECRDFVRIAQKTKTLLNPDENLELFKRYQKHYDQAGYAYLYLLFDYELLDEVEKFLEEQDENDFVKFRALLDLKRSGKHYMLRDLLDFDCVCQKAQ